ncbi:MAG: selenium cofactor biosynthesis protein YqeC [Dehalococcoidia bacterium]
MDLWDALDLDAERDAPRVVAIVGGGGKTALLYRLGRDAEARGLRAVLAGTTRFTPEPQGRMPPIAGIDEPDLPASVEAALRTAPVVVASAGTELQGRLAPISIETADACAAIDGLGLLALEADGSKMLPFKAPAAHEPVIPPCATHVVAVVGADAIDSPLDEQHVHRPQRVRALAGPDAAICGVELIATVLTHPEGGRKDVAGRRFAVLVNKADLAPERAHELALTLRVAGVERVAVTSLRDEADPVREVLT